MSLRVMGVSLTTVQEIWLWFLIPAVLRCIAYIVDLSFACGVLYRHFDQGDVNWGISTLLIIYAPSLVYFVITVSKPNLWNEQLGKMKTFLWFLARLGQLLVFPGWAIYRYGKRIFFSLDALFQSGAARENALDKASAPSRIELYLFLHAFLHGAPQAVLQLSIVLYQYGQHLTVDDTQVLCVFSSLILLTLTIVSFQRFESQRLAGRKEPWAVPPPGLQPSARFSTNNLNVTLQNISPAAPKEDGADVPLVSPPAITVIPPTVAESPDVEVQRRYNQTMSCPMAPAASRGEEQAARCMSLPADFPEAPPPPSASTLDLPTRKTRVKGLEEDDPLGMCVAFLWWFFFVFARFLAFITFFQFYPVTAGVLVAAHYVACTGYLLSVSRFPSVYKVLQQLCLGYAYLFCLIEYKTKFKRVKVVYISYFLIVFIENTTITLIWWYTDNLWQGFWYIFIFVVIFGSYLISMLSMGLYLAQLKPKVTSYFLN